jgi:aminopeptidase N
MKFSRLFILQVMTIVLALMPYSLKAEDMPPERKEIQHDLKIVLYPEEQRFIAEDTITVPKRFLPEFQFILHRGLNPISLTVGVHIVSQPVTKQDMPHEAYKVILPPGISTFVLAYGGTINYPDKPGGNRHARGFNQIAGVISEDGAYLSGSSFWYPVFIKELVTFHLLVELPPEWDAVSQGERTFHKKDIKATYVRWESSEPQEEILIVAARFNEYSQSNGKVLAMVFLRTPDKRLADKYLEATLRYTNMYEMFIGPYPYSKFALVENIWESSFSMPSITLFGPKVIRFPFVINFTFPHEVLHNWWGNSVFPDYEQGNWSEGLTAYLSDHLLKEQYDDGASYRQVMLQKYSDYVSAGRDFPVSEFRSRNSTSSEAIGYGKSLMFFHMLRLELGDGVFSEGLKAFYRKNKFAFSSFVDLMKSFEQVSGKDLRRFFDQWISKPGAPRLKVSNVKTFREGEHYVLSATLEQKQHGKLYLRIPVAVTMEGTDHAYQTTVAMDKKKIELRLILPGRPLRLDVDPEFDVFRRLDRNEIPPAISQALGTKRMLVILPSDTGKSLLQAYRQFARVLSKSGPDNVEIKLDTEVEEFPADRIVTVFGLENRFLGKVFSALSRYKVTINHKSIYIGKTEIPLKDHSMILTARNPENEDMTIMFVVANLPDDLASISWKLPYYHKYSYIAFEGKEPDNTIRGRWPVLDSPMTVFIPNGEGTISSIDMGDLTQRKPLTTLQTIFSEEEMMETIRYLSGDELKGRGLGTEELDEAAQFIANKFREAGLKPAGDNKKSFFQSFEDWGVSGHSDLILKNVIGVIPGKKPEWSEESVVIGAHYDHLGTNCPGREGTDELYCPGADDNASGVAVLIELAKVLGKSLDPDRSVVFVAFTNEEFGKSGSQAYLHFQKFYPANKCIGMLNLDQVGRMKKNKLLVLDVDTAKEWFNIFKASGSLAGVDAEGLTKQLDYSDHKSFLLAGIPAVQFFTGAHSDQHQATDTADKINAAGLVKVASFVKEVVENLANRREPLTYIGKAVNTESQQKKSGLGIFPDVSSEGPGCRVSKVLPVSPAESIGMREGDIIIRINATIIKNCTRFSDALKFLSPGDQVSITFLREDQEMNAKARVAE